MNKLAAATQILDLLRELFPHLLSKLSEEETSTLREIIEGSLMQAVEVVLNKKSLAAIAPESILDILPLPADGDKARHNILMNMNTIEFLIVTRAVKESQENIRRVFKAGGAIFGLVLSLIPMLAGQSVGASPPNG